MGEEQQNPLQSKYPNLLGETQQEIELVETGQPFGSSM